MKVTLTGVVSAQTETRTAGDKQFSDIIIKKEYRDDFGEVTTTNLYPVTLSGDLIQQYKGGEKVKAEAFLQGRESKDGKVFLSLYAKKVEIIP
jgi:hypothetical protein